MLEALPYSANNGNMDTFMLTLIAPYSSVEHFNPSVSVCPTERQLRCPFHGNEKKYRIGRNSRFCAETDRPAICFLLLSPLSQGLTYSVVSLSLYIRHLLLSLSISRSLHFIFLGSPSSRTFFSQSFFPTIGLPLSLATWRKLY